VKIEAEVDAKVPPELWTNFSHLVITQAAGLSRGKNPECGRCPLTARCNFFRKKA
jgi:endonuclease-3